MTLLELFNLLRAHLKIVIILPVLCAVVAAVYCWGFLPNQYTATVSIYALSKSPTSNAQNNASSDLSYSELQTSQMLANDFAELAKNREIQQATATALSLPDLAGYNISVSSSTTSRVMKVSVTGQNPNDVQLVANTFTDELSDTAVRIMGVEAVNVINEASLPTSPSGPNRVQYVLIAFLAGLLVAIAYVVIRDMLNTTVRGDTNMEELLGVPVIGRFPYERAGK